MPFSTMFNRHCSGDDRLEDGRHPDVSADTGESFIANSFLSCRYLQASLFPELSSSSFIDRALMQNSTKGADPDFTKAGKKFLTTVFMQKTLCQSSENARAYLEKHAWLMEHATRSYRKRAIAPSAFDDIDTFDTASPPYVEPNSMVVGLLGTVDDNNTASPTEDGWFISDFYLWKHILRGLGFSQRWLTCLDPEALVKKYGSEDREEGGQPVSWSTGYVYGHADGDRVIVLDRGTLSFAKECLTVCEAKNLRTDYLAILDATFEQALALGRPVVLLMFSHGDIDNSDQPGGLVIGFEDPAEAKASDFLTATDVATVHQKYPEVRLTLFMTSCYSGHWVSTPYFTGKAHVTVVAAGRPEEESWSWKSSNSMRHGGGKFTSALVEEVKLEPTSAAEAANSAEYAELVQNVAFALEGLCNPGDVAKGLGSLPMFTPAAAHEKFWQRTGYSLADYRANFDRLMRIPPSQELDIAQSGGGMPVQDRRSDYGQTDNRIMPATRDLIYKYENSLPTRLPSDESVSRQIHRFKTGKLSLENTRKLQATLAYRLGKCALALHIVKRLDLWKAAATPISQWDPHQELEDRSRFLEVVGKVQQDGKLWFRPEKANDGASYAKPYWYVANALLMHGYEGEEATEQIQKAKKILGGEASKGSKRVRGDKSWKETMAAHREGNFRIQGSPKKGKRAALANIFSDAEDKEN